MTRSFFHQPDLPEGLGTPLLKGDRIIYRSGIGSKFSARVLTVHRNGEVTVKVMFPLRSDNTEWNCGYVGCNYRIGEKNIAGRLA